MTKKEEYLNKVWYNQIVTKEDIFGAMDEYGKYCAEQAWEASENNVWNKLRGKETTTQNSWWNEFKAKEDDNKRNA